MAGHVWLRLEPRVLGFSACGHKQACTLPEMKYVCLTPNKELAQSGPPRPSRVSRRMDKGSLFKVICSLSAPCTTPTPGLVTFNISPFLQVPALRTRPTPAQQDSATSLDKLTGPQVHDVHVQHHLPSL